MSDYFKIPAAMIAISPSKHRRHVVYMYEDKMNHLC